MDIAAPDFAFSIWVQIVLFVMNALCSVLYYYWGISLFSHTHHTAPLDTLDYIQFLLLTAAYLIISVALEYNAIYRRNLINKNEHIAALEHSINDFRGIKHDFNNILQSYTGYISLKDYDKLEAYHRKMVDATTYVR